MATLLNRRRYMGGSKGLPYDAEVEYLESGDGVWLDTGIVPDFDTTVEIKGILYSSGAYLAAARTGSSNANAYYVLMYRDATYCRWIFGSNTGSLYSGLYNKEITILFNEYQTHKAYIDGVEKQTFPSGNVVDTQTTLALFAANGLGTNHYTGKVRINYCKIQADGVLVRDFIPVRKGTTGYMYDKVSHQLFGSVGTGNFILGQDIVPIEYLESNGTQYINTKIYPSTTSTSVELDYAYTDATNERFHGAGYTGNGRFNIGISSNKFRMALGNTWFDVTSTKDANRHKFTLSNQGNSYSGSVDNTSVSGTATNISDIAANPIDINIRGGAESLASQTKCSGRIYGIKITKEGVLVMDAIPVRVGTTGYMLDKVSHTLFANAGTGDFILGTNKT